MPLRHFMAKILIEPFKRKFLTSLASFENV